MDKTAGTQGHDAAGSVYGRLDIVTGQGET
jgi:hypothetical protein